MNRIQKSKMDFHEILNNTVNGFYTCWVKYPALVQ